MTSVLVHQMYIAYAFDKGMISSRPTIDYIPTIRNLDGIQKMLKPTVQHLCHIFPQVLFHLYTSDTGSFLIIAHSVEIQCCPLVAFVWGLPSISTPGGILWSSSTHYRNFVWSIGKAFDVSGVTLLTGGV